MTQSKKKQGFFGNVSFVPLDLYRTIFRIDTIYDQCLQMTE